MVQTRGNARPLGQNGAGGEAPEAVHVGHDRAAWADAELDCSVSEFVAQLPCPGATLKEKVSMASAPHAKAAVSRSSLRHAVFIGVYFFGRGSRV